MKLKCLIVDDEKYSIDKISRYIGTNNDLELIGAETDALVALEKLIRKEIVTDILFLDIMMPGINGIDFASKIKGLCRVVFVTGDKSLALEAFEQDGMDYLVKPYDEGRFLIAVEKVKLWFKGKNPQLQIKDDNLIIQTDKKGTFQVINLHELIYLESVSNIITFKMSSSQSYVLYTSLSAIEERLENYWFIRVHKRFIINTKEISSIISNTVRLNYGYTIPIGPKYKDQFMEEVIVKKLLKK